jgi:hypothetical protein
LVATAVEVIRPERYSAARAENSSAEAAFTKAAFFDRFARKEARAIAEAEHWAH